jgi:pimeloyl-ACP methyl ester carboxylesterase
MPAVRVDDRDVFYEADGGDGGEGPALLFVHGFRNSLESWQPVRSRLDSSRLRAWYLDLPGCGRSSIPASWKDCTVEVYAHDVYRFCQILRLDAVVLVGHSLGGGIALTVALEHPELLRALVLVAPTPADGLGYLSEEQVASLINPSPEELQALARAAFHRPPGPAEFEQLLAVVRSASPQHVEGAVRSQRELQVAGRLQEINVPTLVVGGDRDRHIPIRHTLRTAAAIRRCGVQIYHDIGHAPFFEVPDEFASLIQHFALNEIGPSRPPHT